MEIHYELHPACKLTPGGKQGAFSNPSMSCEGGQKRVKGSLENEEVKVVPGPPRCKGHWLEWLGVALGPGVGVRRTVCIGLPHAPVRQQPHDPTMASCSGLLSQSRGPAIQHIKISLIYFPEQFMQDSTLLIARHG